MAESLLPSLRESARHVAVVQLDVRGGMVPVHISSIGSPLIPSSLWNTISRCYEATADAVVYWRLLVAFLAEPDGDEQVCITGHEEDLYQMEPVKCAALEAVSYTHLTLPTILLV